MKSKKQPSAQTSKRSPAPRKCKKKPVLSTKSMEAVVQNVTKPIVTTAEPKGLEVRTPPERETDKLQRKMMIDKKSKQEDGQVNCSSTAQSETPPFTGMPSNWPIITPRQPARNWDPMFFLHMNRYKFE